jgi:hypothetical protein
MGGGNFGYIPDMIYSFQKASLFLAKITYWNFFLKKGDFDLFDNFKI